ncbi:MAG TPA: prenyltransferase/squalene oxidase repeat-containing protein [Chthoniobacteraceae bacterium]|nr:prenyltransferase/squalene oxidase repeat-containing protein [Chthoniobacteraceae bacterium]
MKTPTFAASALSLLLVSCGVAAEPLPKKDSNLSFRNEVKIALDKGLAWLKARQNEDGSWSTTDHPALSALPLLAFQREPTGRFTAEQPDFLKKGYAFLRGNAKPDGGIYNVGLSNYNTSVALMALLAKNDPADEPLIESARKFVAGQQASGLAKPELNGGFGYGPTGSSPKRQHPDLDNTVVSLEALRAYARARPTKELAAGKDLNWQAAIDFVSRCQNLPATNKEPWASDDPANKGGFIYYPGFSNAGEQELPGGRKALRSYGTISYAGLLSFIYAELPEDDQRVVAALDWLKKNYTLEENPGMGQAGFYYYLHLAAKGLASAGIETLETGNGKKADWTHEIATRLMNLQAADGSWVNDTARWMEKDPVLVTSYSVMTLEIIYNRL